MEGIKTFLVSIVTLALFLLMANACGPKSEPQDDHDGLLYRIEEPDR